MEPSSSRLGAPASAGHMLPPPPPPAPSAMAPLPFAGSMMSMLGPTPPPQQQQQVFHQGSPYFRTPLPPPPLPPPPPQQQYIMGTPDVRIHEMNKRLQQRPESESDGQNFWWDQFATEFFEDDSVLTIQLMMEDGPKRYTIGRTLIPRYFRSIFDGGVADLYIFLKNARESFHNTSLTLDCERGEMHATHVRPMLTNVVTEGRLLLEFTFDDMMRIRSWLFQIRSCREMIPRQALSSHQDPMMLDQMSHNITRQGITNHTLHFLRLCVILEPMQELMSRQKTYGLHPRDCLKTTLFQKWQRMVAPPESSRTQSKRRKRKANNNSNSGGGGGGNNNNGNHGNAAATDGTAGSSVGGSKKGKKKAAGASQNQRQNQRQNQQQQQQQAVQQLHGDVMIVGEPSLMGGEFGAEDERLITRLENRHFDPNRLNGCLRSAAIPGQEYLTDPDTTAQPIGRFTSMLSQHCPPPAPPTQTQGYFSGSKQLHAAYSCPPQNGFEFVAPRTPSQAWPTLCSMVEQQPSGSQTPPQSIQQPPPMPPPLPQQQQKQSHTAIKA